MWHPNFENDENGSLAREARMDAAARHARLRATLLRGLANALGLTAVTIAGLAVMLALGGAHFD